MTQGAIGTIEFILSVSIRVNPWLKGFYNPDQASTAENGDSHLSVPSYFRLVIGWA
jgi:hypothetical protein